MSPPVHWILVCLMVISFSCGGVARQLRAHGPTGRRLSWQYAYAGSQGQQSQATASMNGESAWAQSWASSGGGNNGWPQDGHGSGQQESSGASLLPFGSLLSSAGIFNKFPGSLFQNQGQNHGTDGQQSSTSEGQNHWGDNQQLGPNQPQSGPWNSQVPSGTGSGQDSGNQGGNTGSGQDSGNQGGNTDSQQGPNQDNQAQDTTTGAPAGNSVIQKVLDQHNGFRSLHQVPALSWSENLAQGAQQWADNCVFQHSNNCDGENLAMGHDNFEKAVLDWYNEVQKYSYQNPGFSEETGHFTQIVWKGTTQLGCGLNTGCKLYVCRYFPPGNVEGQYEQNVLPAVSNNQQR